VTHPTGSARRTAALVLALGVGLLTACAGGGESAGATATSSSAADRPSSAAAPTTPEASAAAPTTAESSAPAESARDTVSATEGEMFIDLSEDSFSPGTYTIEATNQGVMAHDLVLERDGRDVARTEVIPPGGTASLQVTLEQGDYVLYCSIGQHRAAGMETDITVSA
jgi:plastocyanin